MSTDDGDSPRVVLDLDMITSPDLGRLAIQVLTEIADRSGMTFGECVRDMLEAYDALEIEED